MTKSFKISIPEPCSQEWENLIPQVEGRFCGSCQKTVIDFTSMTDEELLNYFQHQQGSICGRFNPFQTDRVIAPSSKRKRPSTIPVIAASLVGLLISFVSKAQT